MPHKGQFPNLLRGVYGHTVELTRNGAEALVAARRSTPDLVLLDLNLPDIEGYEVAARMRADPLFEKTILVALTGVGNIIDHARAAAVGFDAHYTKPMDFAVLDALTRHRPAPAIHKERT